MTDTEILNQLQDALMEPRNDGATWPSGLWTVSEVLANLNERQNRFLKSTQLQVGLADLTVTAGVGRYALPDDWLTTVDVYWRTSTGTLTALDRADSFEADHGLPTWGFTRGTPILYMDEDSPLLQIQIAPIPDVDGRLLLLYIPQAAPLDGSQELFTVPNEYVHAVGKYGTLADLFGKDGRGANPEKAAYCEGRYRLAEEMARILLNGWT